MSTLASVAQGVIDTLDAVRRRRQLTQRQLGERTGTNQATVSQLLRGRWVNIQLGTIVRVASALGLDVEVTFRPKQPITPAADPSGSCFTCWCGFQCFGDTGTVAADGMTRDGRWKLWTSEGSVWGLQIWDHLQRCPHAQDTYVVEIL